MIRNFLLILFLISCGQDASISVISCSVEQLDYGVKINCPDKSSAVLLNGLNGKDGECSCHHHKCKLRKTDE